MSVDAETGMSRVVLKASSVGKLYSRSTRDTRTRLGRSMWRALFNAGSPSFEVKNGSDFWGVKDVSFELRRSEAIGFIGLNGSGKTTLLRMLAGQILPDSGSITLAGTSAAMIDLTAGFQRSASGRENIFLRAAALGFSRQQTEQYLRDIIDFSEIEHALDAPMSTYSAGMQMRLAFSIMAIVAPDVLLIDEVLAVGDFRFRQKCLSKIRQMRKHSAFVLVSHSMPDVRNFCDRVFVLHKGKVYFEGSPDEAIKVYEELDPNVPALDEDSKLAAAMGGRFTNDTIIEDVAHVWIDAEGNSVTRVNFDEPFGLKVNFRSTIDIPKITLGIPVWNINAQYLTGLSTQITSDTFEVKAGENAEFILHVSPGLLNPGTIKSMLTILAGPEFLYRNPNPDLTIGPTTHPTWGAVTVPHKWIKVA